MRFLLIIVLITHTLVFSQDFSFKKGTLMDIQRNDVTLGYKLGFNYGLLLGDRNLLLIGPEFNLFREKSKPFTQLPIDENIYLSRSVFNFPVFFAINTSNIPYQNLDFFMKYGGHFGIEAGNCYHTGFFDKCFFNQLNSTKSTRYNIGFSISFELRKYFANRSFLGFNFGGRMINLLEGSWITSPSNEYFNLECGIRYGFNFIPKKTKK